MAIKREVAPSLPAPALTPRPVPPVALTPEQWKQRPDLQVQLGEMLNNPVMRMAFQTLLVTAMPNSSPNRELVAGVSAEAMMLADSNRYHNRSGFAQFHRGLLNLARSAKIKLEGREWGELLPEDPE